MLCLLGYKVIKFTFKNPSNDINAKYDQFVGIIPPGNFEIDKIIQRKHIADNVYILRTND